MGEAPKVTIRRISASEAFLAKASQSLRWLALGLGAITALFAGIQSGKLITDRADSNQTDLRMLYAVQQFKLDALTRDVAALRKGAPQGTGIPADLGQVEERLKALEATQRQISQVIMATPEKALELPMVRRDLLELKAASSEADAGLRREVDRLYTLFLGLLAAIGAAIAAEWLKRPAKKAGEMEA